jgi:hypothetical protein
MISPKIPTPMAKKSNPNKDILHLELPAKRDEKVSKT